LALVLAAAMDGFSRDAVAQASAECAPACGAGETCVNGLCMVPAGSAPAPAPAAPAPAPPAAAPPVPAPPTAVAPAVLPPPAPATARVTSTPSLPDRQRDGLLVLPFVGLHSFQDSNDQGLDAGLRVGSFLGGYVNNNWSLNALAELDVFNPNHNATNSGIDLSGQMLGVTFNPLLHVGNVKAEFVVGPKLGGWIRWDHASGTNSITGVSGSADGTAEGWTIGANMGVFIAASRSVLAGALMSLEVRDILHDCATGTVHGVTSSSCSSSGDSATILGFAFGLML
jgi:hypothetical protein